MDMFKLAENPNARQGFFFKDVSAISLQLIGETTDPFLYFKMTLKWLLRMLKATGSHWVGEIGRMLHRDVVGAEVMAFQCK